MYLLKKLILLFIKTYTAILKCLFVYVFIEEINTFIHKDLHCHFKVFVYVFIKEINYFIQQRCIKLIKSDSKDVNI